MTSLLNFYGFCVPNAPFRIKMLGRYRFLEAYDSIWKENGGKKYPETLMNAEGTTNLANKSLWSVESWEWQNSVSWVQWYTPQQTLSSVSLKNKTDLQNHFGEGEKLTWLTRVCDPLRAETNGSMSMGRYGSNELSRTGTVRQSSTNRSFMCCLWRPLCSWFKPVTKKKERKKKRRNYSTELQYIKDDEEIRVHLTIWYYSLLVIFFNI